MWRWTFKTMIAEPLNFLLTALVVGIALLLVVFFEAVFTGESENIIAYPKNIKPDVWVMQRGVFNMHMATSFIWDWKQDRVAEVEGVANVTPILYLNSIVEAGERRWFSYVVGLEHGNTRAGPWKMVSGKSQPDVGDAIVPALLAEMAGLKLGDTVRIANREFTVTGLSDETFSMANSITFVAYTDIKKIMSLTGSDSFLLVDAEPDISPSILAERIRHQVDKVNALPTREFIKNDRKLAMQMGVELIAIMTIIGAALATVLSVFMLYVFVARKHHDMAMLKALGFGNCTIYLGVVIQAFCITITALLIAILLIYLAIPITDTYTPQITLRVTGHSLLRVGLVTLIVALIASLIPAYRIVKIDPLLAFQRQ